MGMCLEEFGDVSIEVRRESFIIHSSAEGPHPEFLLTELPNLILALEDARAYLVRRSAGGKR
jgi:hypothetical protein